MLQDLKYWYDPVGNITTQEDAAQQTVYFNGMIAAPANSYTYDAIYRLIIAGGRELIGLNTAPNYNDSYRTGQPLPTDTSAMQPYIQYYTYDAVGNMLQMKHTAGAGGYVNYWTRNYTMSGINNRLASTSIGSNNPTPESYTYDARGNMISGMNHLTSMAYNEVNQLQTIIDASGTITTYYQYDYEGQRVRKVSINTGANQTQTRKYFGYWELYDKIDDGTGSIILERETLQIMDDSSRIALIDTPTIDTTGGGEVQLLRYQFSNNLSTATLELDDSAAVITYEEYYPYGSTSFQCGRSGAEVSLKRYRYTGKERDDESGFYYHGARYYAPWLARWLAVDALEAKHSPASPYNYVSNNPIILHDPNGQEEQTSGGSGAAGSGGSSSSSSSSSSDDSKDDGKKDSKTSISGSGGGSSDGDSHKEYIDNYVKLRSKEILAGESKDDNVTLKFMFGTGKRDDSGSEIYDNVSFVLQEGGPGGKKSEYDVVVHGGNSDGRWKVDDHDDSGGGSKPVEKIRRTGESIDRIEPAGLKTLSTKISLANLHPVPTVAQAYERSSGISYTNPQLSQENKTLTNKIISEYKNSVHGVPKSFDITMSFPQNFPGALNVVLYQGGSTPMNENFNPNLPGRPYMDTWVPGVGERPMMPNSNTIAQNLMAVARQMAALLKRAFPWTRVRVNPAIQSGTPRVRIVGRGFGW